MTTSILHARQRLPSAIVATTLIAASAPALAGTPWALFERSCPRGTSSLEVPCGNLGVYHFVDVVAPAGCTALDTGVDENTAYPAPRQAQEAGGVGQVGVLGGQQRAQLPGRLGDPNPLETPWIAVVDFDSEHGASTHWLADTMAGPAVRAELFLLDDPALDALGETVTDLHVLAATCRVAEAVDQEGRPPPITLNMSFGRAAQHDDARDANTCARDRASCQVSRVLQHLDDKGTIEVAAAGNHKGETYPAALRGVIDTGMLDLNQFFAESTAAGAWESPSPTRALIPGNALCLRGGWPAPGGSSYSSALLAGWLANLATEGIDVGANTQSAAPYEPRYDAQQACYVLARGDDTYGTCNHVAGTLFNGIEHDGFGRCWHGSRPNMIHSDPLGDAEQALAITPFDQWVAGNGPLPESDPCVPCVGNLFGPQSDQDLSINMSQSGAIADGLVLDKVYLRADQDFFPLPLASTQLGWIAAGLVSELVLPSWGSVAGDADSSSLIFVMRTPGQSNCDAPPTPGCLWTSSALYIAQ